MLFQSIPCTQLGIHYTYLVSIIVTKIVGVIPEHQEFKVSLSNFESPTLATHFEIDWPKNPLLNKNTTIMHCPNRNL